MQQLVIAVPYTLYHMHVFHTFWPSLNLLTFRHILKWMMSHNVFVCMFFAFGPNFVPKALFFALVVHF